ncbi:hypothetical protein DY023_04905 [Microbacterium bovistercoris]|uniref:Uncharacterized protein n=1 Tax=Microbacterium bovistercoris TaxID=2293570 RepID=A0A371NVX5_9MICO|nr:hypothetical protein [Microbacterium bovistercoris]REJ06913.1 hypothetical protein DY023_04905 [Microbacterium bovistercoris]
MDIAFTYDAQTSIVIPGDALTDDSGNWARTAAAEFSVAHAFDEAQTATLVGALEKAQRGARGSAGTNLFIFHAANQAWFLLRLVALERELTDDEQRKFLWPESITRPQLRSHYADGLGPGCSATTSTEEGAAGIRWVYPGIGRTLFAMVATVPSASVLFAGSTAEMILESVRIDGWEKHSGTAFDVDRLFPAGKDGAWIA